MNRVKLTAGKRYSKVPEFRRTYGPCGKVLFETEIQAKAAIATGLILGSWVYYHEPCDGWHTTSMPQSGQKAVS